MSGRVRHIMQYLDANGDGTGAVNAIGNYATPTPFYITPQNARERYSIERILIHVEDDANFNADGYGGLSELSNGIIVRIVRRDGSIEVLSGQTVGGGALPITKNSHWARICYDTAYSGFPSGNNYVHVRWTFGKSGEPVWLEFGDQLQVLLNDNFSTMVGHYFKVQGVVR